MRIFVFVFLSRIVFFLLFLTSSSSSKTKQIIAAATHLFTILFFVCVELLEELLEGLYKPFKHVVCYLV